MVTFVPRMIKQARAATSDDRLHRGFFGGPTTAPYSAAKAAVINHGSYQMSPASTA